MGLDISVNRITKRKAEYYFRLIDDDGNYENNFPEWTKNYEREVTEDWYDWTKYKSETGIDINECDWHGEEYSDRGNFMNVTPKGVEYSKDTVIEIDLDKVPTYKKKIKVLYYNERGYQRKGLNGKFYDDYRDGKIGYFVWSKKELNQYKQNYCDEPYEYVYPNGDKSGDMVYPKDNFQNNIIKKFVEGKDVVTFDW